MCVCVCSNVFYYLLESFIFAQLPSSLSLALTHLVTFSSEHVHVCVSMCTDKLLKRAFNAEMIKLKRL